MIPGHPLRGGVDSAVEEVDDHVGIVASIELRVAASATGYDLEPLARDVDLPRECPPDREDIVNVGLVVAALRTARFLGVTDFLSERFAETPCIAE